MTWRSRGLRLSYPCGDIQRQGFTSRPRRGLPERCVDHSYQAIILERLFEEIGCTQLHGFYGKRNIAMSCHDQNPKRATACFEAFQKLDTVDTRHAYVRDDATKIRVWKRVEEMMSRLEKRDMKVRGTEQEIEGIPHRVVIVDHINISPM
jgi:hypothetical protein